MPRDNNKKKKIKGITNERKEELQSKSKWDSYYYSALCLDIVVSE